ncbi:MAG: hypothetical protein SCARUB_00478 [Candidatus Scalindua rubra]|uniref:Uncharacterized protein n=1 Tax=Candidatus Scalindua rubra TaxID=1872076 RepID=A0A1E3XFD7_9BACT|nr:MAG: hypothetical protein SCARUB_00478 [Candidatus Scalindua rubra]
MKRDYRLYIDDILESIKKRLPNVESLMEEVLRKMDDDMGKD